jgi:NDP-sugar pyrophosphorylase family protein
VSPDARIEDGARVEGPCFIDEGTIVKAGAHIAPYTVLGRQCHIEEDARIEGSIVWANCRIGRDAVIRQSILGRHCHVGRNSILDAGVVLGDKSAVTDYSKL